LQVEFLPGGIGLKNSEFVEICHLVILRGKVRIGTFIRSLDRLLLLLLLLLE